MKIILLSYLSRSGSTMVCDILIKDKRFCVCPEAEILTNKLLKEPNKKLSLNKHQLITLAEKNDRKLKHWNINIPRYNKENTNLDFFIQILDQFKNSKKSKAEFIVFKSEGLENFNIGLYKNFFKIIMFRDPRAIFLSQKTNTPSIGNGKMNINPKRLVFKANRLVDSYKDQLRCGYVQYEKFIEDKPGEIIKLQNILSIESFNFKNDKDSVLDIIPKSQIHLHTNINKKSMNTSLDKWKQHLSKYEIYIIQNNFKDTLKLGYNKVIISISLTEKIKSYILIKIFDVLNKFKKYKSRFIK